MPKYIVYIRPCIRDDKFTIEAENDRDARKQAYEWYFARSNVWGDGVLENLPKFTFCAINEVKKEKAAIRKRRLAKVRKFFERIVERLKQAETKA